MTSNYNLINPFRLINREARDDYPRDQFVRAPLFTVFGGRGLSVKWRGVACVSGLRGEGPLEPVEGDRRRQSLSKRGRVSTYAPRSSTSLRISTTYEYLPPRRRGFGIQ